MKNQGLLLGFAAALLGAAFILTGCESPTDGSAGAAGTIYLSGDQTSEGIQAAIDSGAPVVFAGVILNDNARPVLVPAGRGVKLVGDGAFTVTSGTLVLGGAGSVAGDGKIAVGGSGTVIGPATALAASVTGAGSKVAFAEIGSDGALTFTGGKAAVNGNVTVGATEAAGTIIPATLAGNTLYVVGGKLTLAAAATGAATIFVDGDVDVTTAQTQALDLTISGNLTAAETPTTGTGALKVGGTASFTKALTVGAASFGGAASFADNATFAGAVSFGGDVTLASGKALTLSTTSAVLTLANGKTIAGVIKADGAAATLTPEANAALTAGTDKLTLGGAGLAVTTGKLAVVTGKDFELTKALTVAAGAELSVAGTATAGTGGSLVLTGAASNGGAKLSGAGKVVLGNASISGGTGAWQADGASTSIAFSSSAATEAAITGAGTTPVLKALTDDSAVITLAKSHTAGDHAALTVSTATIDISAKGAIVFPYVATTGASLKLLGETATLGKLKLGDGNTDNTNVYLTQGGHSVTISGTGPVIKGATADGGAAAGFISGGAATPANDATITGKTADDDVTIKAGATLAAASI